MAHKKNKPAKDKEIKDDDNPGHAPESGEPKEAGRTRGHPTEEARPKGYEDKPGEEDWESGRQDAVE